jgi:hypothetical protein
MKYSYICLMTNVRTKGNNAERKFIIEINRLGLGYKLMSSRLLSKYMDDQGVDLVDAPNAPKKFPFHIQSKSYTSYLKYNDLFSQFQLVDKPLVIFHELTEKRGSRFFKVEDYVIMKKTDFYEILKNCKI